MTTRRVFLGGLAAASARCAWAGVGGRQVKIGAISYSYRTMPHRPFAMLDYAVASGVDSLELMGRDAEVDAGAPDPYTRTSEGRKALNEWRLRAGAAVFREIAAKYAARGMGVHIVKFGEIGDLGMSDALMDYFFGVAQAFGAGAVTCEIPKPVAWERCGKRLAAWSEKFGVKVAFHNHLQIDAKTYDGPLLGYGPGLAINYDIAQYIAANDDDPVAFVEKYRDRLFSIHVKDGTSRANGGKLTAFGEGDVPLARLLKTVRRINPSIACDVELEYSIPKDSDAVKETAKCVNYCRRALA